METKSISQYFNFGSCFWYLMNVNVGYPIHNRPDLNLNFVLVSIKLFIDSLEQLNLQVTRNASWQLLSFQKSIENAEKDRTLDKNQVEQLRKIMKEIEPTLLAELTGLNTYVVTPKRLDVTKLQNNVPSLFAPNVFEKIPALAQFDLGEAGKCIAFERCTAAAFHMMRATEDVLRQYYCLHINRNRVKPLLWGSMTRDLQNRHKFQNDEKRQVLFKNLDNIRLSFRNPTQHPDKIYDIQEVQDLWGLCVDVINRMASDLPKGNESK